jgi:hypothetical protein
MGRTCENVFYVFVRVTGQAGGGGGGLAIVNCGGLKLYRERAGHRGWSETEHKREGGGGEEFHNCELLVCFSDPCKQDHLKL